MAIKHLLLSDHSKEEMHETDSTYTDLTIGFI
jgi:hypothetical protein